MSDKDTEAEQQWLVETLEIAAATALGCLVAESTEIDLREPVEDREVELSMEIARQDVRVGYAV